MRILVTGARGLLGTPLCELLAREHDVTGVDIEEMDITDAAQVATVMDAARPERVVHLAAWTDVDGCEREPAQADAVNAVGTRNLAEACAERGVALLYVSTDYVFDGRKAEPYVESDPTGPLSAYGRSKLAGETAVRELLPQWWVVRLQSVYGLKRRSFVDAILARARAGEELSVVTDQRVSPSYAPDLAAGVAAVLLRAEPGIYHLSNSGSCTWYDCAQHALATAGLADVPVRAIEAAELGRPAPRPGYSVFSCDRLLDATGHRMRPWQDALNEYLRERALEESQ